MGRALRSAQALLRQAAGSSRGSVVAADSSLQLIKLFDITGSMGAQRLFANGARLGLLGEYKSCATACPRSPTMHFDQI